MDLNSLAKQIYIQNKEKGFWDKERNIGETLMLIVTELSEALESHRGRKRKADVNAFEYQIAIGSDFKMEFEKYIKDSFEDEIADSIIRLLDLCGGLGIDINWHVKNKLEYNKLRKYLHGKNY